MSEPSACLLLRGDALAHGFGRMGDENRQPTKLSEKVLTFGTTAARRAAAGSTVSSGAGYVVMASSTPTRTARTLTFTVTTVERSKAIGCVAWDFDDQKPSKRQEHSTTATVWKIASSPERRPETPLCVSENSAR